MTIATDNVDRFATRPETATAWERHAAVRRAGHLIRTGDRPQAVCVLARSVERQLRIEIGAKVRLTPPCGCGGRCNDPEPADSGHATRSTEIRGLFR